MARHGVSVVVPTLNEEENIRPLVERIARAFSVSRTPYEIIFIDDHSTDRTQECIEALGGEYPVRFFVKQGARGKAYSLLEGFALIRYRYVAVLDADLQYPPEVLPDMVVKLESGVADIVVAERTNRETAWWRRILSGGFRFVFGKFLHDLDCDVQAGCKMFRSKILREVTLDPTPWTFDLEFLLSARNYGYVIDTVPVQFVERVHGESKIHFFRAVREIGWNAIKLRLRGRPPLLISPESVEKGMIGAGVAHNRQRFVTHSTLHPSVSALSTFAPWQSAIIWGVVLIILIGLVASPLVTGTIVIGLLSATYFVDMFFNLWLIVKSLKTPPEIESTEEELRAISDESLPIYSVLCPLYREAHILPGFVEAIERIEWPKDKLDVLLLLEEDDDETIRAAHTLDLPEYIRVVVVPHSFPKTKPKACNYGLSHASGEYVVIYDAEDIPDPWQLRKAYLGFQKVGPEVKCLQAKLNYFNPDNNLLTRFFTAEYSLWFDVTLVGLQSINTSLPLGGTSNHFRTADLLELEGWDPFNVTEDCDLGVRIFKRGARTAIIDSVTLEEANSRVKNWLRQRSRWVKGYMQTYLVHMRDPLTFARENGWHALIFQLVVGGKIAFLLINPILWITTVAYFVFRDSIGPAIEALYLDLVYYMAVTSLVFGNFLFMYYYMIGCAKRGHWHLVKYVFLIPLYWILGSIASYIALYQLIVKPHYWEKTTHGLHLLRGKERRWQRKASTLFDWASVFTIDFSRRVTAWFRGTKHFASVLWNGISTKSAVLKFKPSADEHVSTDIDNERSGPIVSGVSAEENESVWLSVHARSLHNFIFSSEGLFLVSLFISSIFNFIFNAFLGRVLSFESFGLVAFINTIWYFSMIFLGAYGTTVNHETAYHFSLEKMRSGRWFRFILRKSVLIMAGISLVWFISIPWLSEYFQTDIVALYFFTPVFLFGIVESVGKGFIQGSMRFRVASAIVLFESFSKLLLAAGLVFSGYPDMAYLAIPYSVVFSGVFTIFFVRNDLIGLSGERSVQIKFPSRFYMAALVGSVGSLLFLNLDVLLVKHYLDSESVGEYALLALVGKMIFFLGTLPASLLVTLVSRAEGRRRNPRVAFYKIYILTLLFVAGSVMSLVLFGDVLVLWLLGERSGVIVPFLPIYSLALGFFTLSSVIATYHLARRQYLFPLIPLFTAFLMGFLIVMNHETIWDISVGIFSASLVGWVVIQSLDVFEKQFHVVWRGVRDLFGVFGDRLPGVNTHDYGHHRILVFNWRDKRHKYAGGAEEYVHEIAKEWVAQGHQVTLFCGNDGHCPRHETIDGIDIIRRGGFYLVYVWAFLYYLLRFRGQYDIIVDCQNGVPFFTPLYVRKPVFCLMHHVHQSVFFRDLVKPLAYVASFLEKDLMPLVYRNVRFITVSESSKRGMEFLGLGKVGIDIVNPGVHLEELGATIGEKSDRPTVLYLGRLKSYKSVDVLIRAFAMVLDRIPGAQLIIAGSGDEERTLKRLAVHLDLTQDQVVFLGHVSDMEKIRLLRSAWVFVIPSSMEGWGIVTIEANACGTPVIASDVPGLRDSVLNNQSGILVPYGDEVAFAERISQMLEDTELRESMSQKALEWAQNFAWRRSGKTFLSILENHPVSRDV